MKRLLSALLIIFSLNAYSNENQDFEGIWAMVPLKNGIANVVQYNTDGTSSLYSFNCAKPDEKEPIETYTYTVDKENKTITLTSGTYQTSLKIVKITKRTMALEQKINDDFSVSLLYAKVSDITPLCGLYTGEVNPPPKTAYQPADFIPDPVIPPHPELSRFEGKWMYDNVVQIEVTKNSDGNFMLKLDSNQNWNHLYNQVHWVGDELHFKSYAYSDKESLYEHPYHKSRSDSILRLTSDTTMTHSHIIGKERYDTELIKQ